MPKIGMIELGYHMYSSKDYRVRHNSNIQFALELINNTQMKI